VNTRYNIKNLISNNTNNTDLNNLHEHKHRFSTRILAEIIMLVALGTALSLISHSFFRLPQGGSINIGMVPLFWLALRRGWKIGILGGFLFGVIDLAFDPFIVHPIQLLLDYPLPYAAIGLAGFFQKYAIVGIGVGITGRFICHTLSGIIYFADYTPEGLNPIIYSAGYNATYLIPSAIVCAILVYTLMKTKVLKIYM
jgi:thiamine transporter